MRIIYCSILYEVRDRVKWSARNSLDKDEGKEEEEEERIIDFEFIVVKKRFYHIPTIVLLMLLFALPNLNPPFKKIVLNCSEHQTVLRTYNKQQ